MITFFHVGIFALALATGPIFMQALVGVMATLGLAALVWETRVINRAERASRKPDYAYIARMEIEIYGRNFTNPSGPIGR